MKNLLSKRQISNSISYAHLCAIWYVDADSTYHTVKRPGTHDSDYIAVRTISGHGLLTDFNSNKYELPANSLGIFRSDDVARYEASSDGWEFYWFRFNHDHWNEKLNWVSYLSISPSEKEDFERCFAYLNSGVIQECAMAEALFNYLLSNWFIRLNAVSQKNMPLQEIISILEKGRLQKLPLNVLAKEAGMCERSFRDAVHRATGMSPSDYMLKIKIETAMDLLQTTNNSISEISSYLNYDNPFYFSRVFKKHFGISPAKARGFISK